MDFAGTNNNDEIDQLQLRLPEWTTIYGRAGNDTIKISNAVAIGEAGDDTFIGSTRYSTVGYANSPSGVMIDLAAGTAVDGFGGQDRLTRIYVVQDSWFDDTFTGSSADETFWLNHGNDVVRGGGGRDTVMFYGVKSTDVNITYDAPADTFTVVRNHAGGETSISKLTNIATLSFTGAGSDESTISRDVFAPYPGFSRASETSYSANMDQIQQMRTGDFNGDGQLDLLVTRVSWVDLGASPIALQVLTGDGKGKFVDQTAAVFQGGVQTVHYVPRIFAADFNGDSITDIFAPDFGIDGPPFPGGQNSLFVSSSATQRLQNLTLTLPQALRQNHGASIGDVNGDGYLDILVNALHEGTGHADDLLINDGKGHFLPSPQLLPASVNFASYNPGHTWSLLEDLNNDGWADMVLGTWDASTKPSEVFLNDGKGSFATSKPISLPRSGVDKESILDIKTINLNGDALPDLVLSITNGGDQASFYQVPYLQFLVNDGNGGYRDETQQRLPQSKTVIPGAAPDWYMSATVVDLDHDGFDDVVVDDATSIVSKVYMNDTHGRFIQTWESRAKSHVVVADIDQDGMSDLIESTSQGFSVLYNRLENQHIYRASFKGGDLLGSSGNDVFHSGYGSDRMDGGKGLDRVVYAQGIDAFDLSFASQALTVTSKTGTKVKDTLVNVERIAFADTSVALDIDGNAGQAYRLYQAALNRKPDLAGLGVQMNGLDSGMSLQQIAQNFINSAEFGVKYGTNLSNGAFVTQLYANVLHRAPDPGGYAVQVNALDNGVSRAQLLVNFSESPENYQATLVGIQNGIAYTPVA